MTEQQPERGDQARASQAEQPLDEVEQIDDLDVEDDAEDVTGGSLDGKGNDVL